MPDADELFFPETASHLRIREAKAICARCPVIDPCLQEALDTQEPYGIRGGLTAWERRKLVGRSARGAGQARRSGGGPRQRCTHPDSERYTDAEGHNRCRTCKRASDQCHEQRRTARRRAAP